MSGVGRMARRVAGLWLAILAGCHSPPTAVAADAAPDSPAPVDRPLGADRTKLACPDTPCRSGYVCHKGSCILDQGPCSSSDSCQNDSVCRQGSCVPYEADQPWDPQCTAIAQAFPKEDLLQAPQARCNWSGGNVLMTPVVADLDGDGIPEVIVNNDENAHLVALRSDDCSVVFDVAAQLAVYSQLAVADLNQDKVPEIVGVKEDGRIAVFSSIGMLLAVSADPASSYRVGGGLAIANLDGVGPPEIVFGGGAWRLESGQLKRLYDIPVEKNPVPSLGHVSAIADVDLDGTPDVVVGNRIFDGPTGIEKTPAAASQWPSGYVAIAQIDETTPEPEIVLVSYSASDLTSTLRAFHPVTGQVSFGPFEIGQGGGPPTIADFDGDKKPEIGVTSQKAYVVFDPDCAKTPLPASCAAPGILWKRAISELSSGYTAAAVFDFNGDGYPEVVYRDECWLRFYEGATGKLLSATSMISGTILDLPVVADLDGDGHADLVVVADDKCCSTPPTSYCVEPELGLVPAALTRGVFLLQDRDNRWMPTRSLWNQHTYHITNINDDGGVPLLEPKSWLSHNSYRQNRQGQPGEVIPAVDLTASPDPQEPSLCSSTWPLRAKVCNRGTARSLGPVQAAFYDGDPRQGGQLLCTTTTKMPLAPGWCDKVSCDGANPSKKETLDLWLSVDGPGAGSVAECREGNNLLHLPGTSCLGID
jgi:hypothetical protein